MQGYKERHYDNHDNESEEVEHIEFDIDTKKLEWDAHDAYTGLRLNLTRGDSSLWDRPSLVGEYQMAFRDTNDVHLSVAP